MAPVYGVFLPDISRKMNPRQNVPERELFEEIGADISVKLARQLDPVRDEFLRPRFTNFNLFHLHWLSGRISLNQ